jgi:hypothetical protein
MKTALRERIRLLYVYTRANVFEFAMNPGYFYIGCVLPFTLMNMNPVQNYHRYRV